SPPLRSQRDRDAIRQALVDGTIDAICSDHTPVDDDEKLLPFGEASPGATGLELLLSLSLKWAAETLPSKEQLAAAVARISVDPARVAGLDAGQLSVGSMADVCIFDPETCWTVNANALTSQGKHTPFIGYELQGRVSHTIVSGRLAFSRSA
ncbi:MAG: amidohydrolase family protein, partial [Betaproteobacteria bacterium]|nr:amidohydrolase family protein [Betaproteobacteria bacterium]